MTLSDLFGNVEVQGEYEVCYYDEKANKRVYVDVGDPRYWNKKPIAYFYVEKGVLHIELSEEDLKDE